MATGCEESASKKQKGHRLASPSAAASNQGRPTEATAVTRAGSWALMGATPEQGSRPSWAQYPHTLQQGQRP